MFCNKVHLYLDLPLLHNAIFMNLQPVTDKTYKR